MTCVCVDTLLPCVVGRILDRGRPALSALPGPSTRLLTCPPLSSCAWDTGGCDIGCTLHGRVSVAGNGKIKVRI